MAATDIDKGKPVKAYIDEIRKAGERSAGLTKQLLVFSRRQIFNPEVTNLNDLISGLENMLVPMIGQHIYIQMRLSPNLSSVMVDRAQIEQVVMNMVVNSRDAMSGGGNVVLATADVYIDESAASSQPGLNVGSYVTFTVSDNGAGIPHEVLSHMFEPFYTSKELGKGTGLGLSMSHGIVAQSGGYIAVKSALGQGTTFTVYLPAVDGIAENTTAGGQDMVTPEGNESILLVEEEPIVRRVATKILGNQGYSVEEATNGKEALELLSKHSENHFDILITDLVMPMMGGRELVERFRETHPHTNVLYMTGYTDEDFAREGELESYCSIIQKPFTANTLAQQVRKILDLP